MNGFNNVEHLILTVGTSKEPMIFSINEIKPKKVMFLYTEESEKTVEEVISVINYPYMSVKHYKVGKTDPIQIYRCINEYYTENKIAPVERIFVDFTGGTKAMAAAAAMAGVMLGFQMVYVESDYDPVARRPKPGSERLSIIENPYRILGLVEYPKALSLFETHSYFDAVKILDELLLQMPHSEEKNRYQITRDLANAYGLWDNLDFRNASETMDSLIERVEINARYDNTTFLADRLDDLKKQGKILRTMKENQDGFRRDIDVYNEFMTKPDMHHIVHYLMYTLENASRHFAKAGKYDLAALYTYRLFEMIVQKRLASHAINPSNPDYSGIDEEVKKRLIEIDTALNNNAKNNNAKNNNANSSGELPDKISFIVGCKLLLAFEDDLFGSYDRNQIRRKLYPIIYQTEARNYSILAHGFQHTTENNYESFKRLLDEYFHKMEEIESIKPVSQYMAHIRI